MLLLIYFLTVVIASPIPGFSLPDFLKFQDSSSDTSSNSTSTSSSILSRIKSHLSSGKSSTSSTATMPQVMSAPVYSSDWKAEDGNITQMFATFSPYWVGDGWGVSEEKEKLPQQCRVKEMHMLARHGSRLPLIFETQKNFGYFLSAAKKLHIFKARDELSFLNTWKDQMGRNSLTNIGRYQHYVKGERTYKRYGDLLQQQNGSIVVRTTSTGRMIDSSKNFLEGFLGTNWDQRANLVVTKERLGANNTLSPYWTCPTFYAYYGLGTQKTGAKEFQKAYLKDAVARFNQKVRGFKFTTTFAYDMQSYCTYEVNTFGKSDFCGLFTQQEWEDYGYYNSWVWYNQNMYTSPTARAMGSGWAEEFRVRLTKTPYDPARQTMQDIKLDTNSSTFPLNQTMYIDFGHDAMMTNLITYLSLEQFRSNFTGDGKTQFFDASKVVPFAAQMVFEVIECDGVYGNTTTSTSTAASNATISATSKYIRLVLNERVVNLSKNIPGSCASRDDGWCDFDSFLEHLDSLLAVAKYQKSCHGLYNYGKLVTNGVVEE